MLWTILLGLAILSVAMIPLDSRWPGVSGQRRFRRGWVLDLVDWFYSTLITKPTFRIAVAVAMAPVLLWNPESKSFQFAKKESTNPELCVTPQ